MKCIACWNTLYAISQSLWFLTVLVGFKCPKWNLNSSNVSVAQLSVTVEQILEMMTSRSTAFPCSTLTHLESGNSDSPLALNRLCFVTLMLRVRFWMSLQVSSWLGVSTLISESSSHPGKHWFISSFSSWAHFWVSSSSQPIGSILNCYSSIFGLGYNTVWTPPSFFLCTIISIRKVGRHWYDQTVTTRANLVDTVWYFLIYNYHKLKLC